jgi:hypothetical protein
VCVTTSRYLPPGEVWAKFKGSTAAARTVREPLRPAAGRSSAPSAAVGAAPPKSFGRTSQRASATGPKGTAPLVMEQRKGGKGHQQSHKKVVRWRDFCVIFAYTLFIFFLKSFFTCCAPSHAVHAVVKIVNLTPSQI